MEHKAATGKDALKIISPTIAEERGCQISIIINENGKEVHRKLTESGVIVDWREPDVIRAAPVPLYNTYEEVWRFAQLMAAYN